MLVDHDDELKPVTVLFADIVGSTALGERLAPHELKTLVGTCVDLMSRAVEGFGGTVQAYTGDGICAYFGVPTAHEDDAERAARAALRILESVESYRRDAEAAWSITGLSVRIGINSGQAAVGLVGAGDRRHVALGDATNVAARLESIASPGTIVAGEATAKHLRDRFPLEALGSVAVKGRAREVTAWRIERHRAGTPAAAATPFVGRQDELRRLRTIAGELVDGCGQILLIVGEAGIGKSRLLAELRASLGDGATWLQGHCPSYAAVSYALFAELARDRLEGTRGEAEATLAAALPDPEPRAGRDFGATDGGTERAYTAWIESLTGRSPVVLALEDLQWADRGSRALAEHLLELTDRAPLLVAATLRPDAASEGWRFRLRARGEYPHRAVELAPRPLEPHEAETLVGALLPGLDRASRDAIVARAEGNPLYLEELQEAWVDGAGPARRSAWTLSGSPRAHLPPALETLLVARIDRLPEGPRRLAQIAAVLGRTFRVTLLERVAGGGIEEDLGVLLRTEVVRESRRYPELECTFKHGLLQEAALSTLTPPSRRAIRAAATSPR